MSAIIIPFPIRKPAPRLDPGTICAEIHGSSLGQVFGIDTFNGRDGILTIWEKNPRLEIRGELSFRRWLHRRPDFENPHLGLRYDFLIRRRDDFRNGFTLDLEGDIDPLPGVSFEFHPLKCRPGYAFCNFINGSAPRNAGRDRTFNLSWVNGYGWRRGYEAASQAIDLLEAVPVATYRSFDPADYLHKTD